MTHDDVRSDVIVMDGAAVSFGELPSVISMHPVVEGPETAVEVVVADDAGGFCAVWEAQPGVYPRVKDKRGSAMLILAGDAVVTDGDGTPHEVHEGSVLVLPYRWEGQWNIRRTIRKVYIYSWPTAEPAQRPAKAVSSAGADYATAPFETALTAQVHLGSLPDLAAEVISDGVDGMCGIVRIAAGVHAVSPGQRWAYLYVQAGSLSFRRGGNAPIAASAGAVVAVPRGWAGVVEVGADVSAFAFFTSEKREDGTPSTLRSAP